LMLGAGVHLFAVAQWNNFSPAGRLAIVIAMVAAFHTAGAFASARGSEGIASVMHGIGTVSLGAGAFLTTQVNDFDFSWPSGATAMLWAVGGWVAWALRGDWVQLALAAIFTPWWLAMEWADTAPQSASLRYYLPSGEGLLLLSFCYLAARTRDRDDASRRALVWIGAVGVMPLAVWLASVHETANAADRGRGWPWEILAYSLAFALPLALACWLRGRDAWTNAIAAAWVALLGAIALTDNVGVYVWCGLGAAGLVVWGIRDGRSERINLGMIGFAFTLMCFYFAEVMGNVGRATSLIGLGVLFLAGGWVLERMRRRFVAQVRPIA
jgi:uncharacterized membrane protein